MLQFFRVVKSKEQPITGNSANTSIRSVTSATAAAAAAVVPSALPKPQSEGVNRLYQFNWGPQILSQMFYHKQVENFKSIISPKYLLSTII